ncbi:hypothetical protein ASPZODRAFT_2059234 [Penicilliopsis zonata CBS 506.65]|uniref:RZ-type domain-containing protein n=1 Tax=Penicilliopsis zonata CBS 506.65 TaxID=1073090 RepID=A0A1L9SG79_9EURO|nr:hypothetical protein ASPZODRAFT_2059234 [Penicilliopsis zonata CBS 506.65]OJJ46123.1 hypothetical protein ASPZODRAFT_2059234 [Penicilliopsis zonata CBS 506.65]
MAWKRQAPQSQFIRPLGAALGRFFAQGRSLIDVDDSTLQEVVQCLSKEGGLKRIQELIQRDYLPMSDSAKLALFLEQVLPFVEIITAPKVLASLILEQSVGTIYNCIFGLAGRRATPFLNFLADVVQREADSQEDAAALHLESCLQVFTQVLQLNSTAFIHEPIIAIAKRFRDIFTILNASVDSGLLEGSHNCLERLQRYLDIGLSLPSLNNRGSSKGPVSQVPVQFVTQKEPPGGRHDNDHPDICRIRIMPTSEEILSTRSEYLPVTDPREWHVQGLSGLLDRNFRLLREDSVGQLRDAIHTELQPQARREKNQMRTHVYSKARVQGFEFDRLTGLQIILRFPQPANLKDTGKKKRQEWWELSKRLQPTALVCLADRRGFAIFCTISQPKRQRQGRESEKERPQKFSGSLWDDAAFSFVVLELVEPTEANRQYILDCHQPNNDSPTMSLVEFPGILLPSFQPTLQALQNMQKAADLPMSEFLAPSDSLSGSMDVPPPAYANKRGFTFDLRCLMDDGSSLEVSPSQPADMDRLRQHSTLDDAQAQALVHTLQRRIGLIQGPPGTGKSYTGVALIKVLLANKKKVNLGPIVCVCYTNHALDQLLEDLLESKITSQIIRIGSQSKSETLKSLNLREASQKVQKTRLEKTEQWQLHHELEEHEEEWASLRLNAAGSHSAVRHYLRRFNTRRYKEFFEEDEEGFEKAIGNDPHKIFTSWLNGGKTKGVSVHSLEELHQLRIDEMNAPERRILYDHWAEEIRKAAHTRTHAILASQQQAKASLDRVRNELDLRCLRQADVIGVTTTGLARNLNMLRGLQSKVLLCEEAGEVLEAHLLTSLLPSVEHFILIGDHQQLRPQIQNYELSRESKAGKQYSLDCSLFERLVEPQNEIGVKIPFCTLETQRRMHPSIAQLVRETLYPRLQDAPSVSEYPEVMGVRRRLFWLDHRKPEGGTSGQDPTATSHWNDHEIEVTHALVNHLIRQGTYKTGEIAVLTPYLGQLHRLRRKLGESFAITVGERDQDALDQTGFTDEEKPLARAVPTKSTLLQTLRVATIDNFQGEEAKVVVISLVRSNSQNRCGFLRTPNRINVLLSRAKHGMYIIGNSETSRGVEMWAKVLDILDRDGNFGQRLELQCPRHPATVITVAEPEDFLQFSPEGGCNLQCGKRLSCGHPCKQKCHAEMLHQSVHCLEPCSRLQKGCSHPCPKVCGDICPTKCMTVVVDHARVLPCGHSMPSLHCWQAQDLSTVKCPVLVKKKVPHCDHEITIACHIDVAQPDYECRQRCRQSLPCGHNCKRRCSECIIREPEGVRFDHGQCKQKCGRQYHTCAHTCITECHGEIPCPPCTAPCDVQCGHSRCPRKCSQPCAPCAVPKCLSECPHSACSMPCAAPCDHIPCSRRCEKNLPCGHRCPSVCGELCPTDRFCQLCAADDIKETPVDFILGQLYKEVDLDENPCIFPPCGHFLTMESMDAQMDLGKHYTLDQQGKPASIASASEPFSIGDIRNCATCRGSLRGISRYGRLVRRAWIDEATKKFILYINQQYVPMAQDLPRLLTRLQENEKTISTRVFQDQANIRIEGPRDHQVKLMNSHIRKHDKERWKGLIELRGRIVEYASKVKEEEQPFHQVYSLVEDARRRKRGAGRFEFDDNVLQTKGYLQASGLLLRLDTALLGDFLALHRRVPAGLNQTDLQVNLQANLKDSEVLIELATRSRRVLQQVEGHLFRAQLCALEMENRTPNSEADARAKLLDQANSAVDAAERLCACHPGQTQGLAAEIEGTRAMLRGATFYTPVTNEERMAVVAAMAREFRGTGHWYYCQNGHPFTIGECGGAMQLSRCPECGAQVGGEHHRTVDGVRRAEDLEAGLRELNI